MGIPNIHESENRFCLIMWEHEPITAVELVKQCQEYEVSEVWQMDHTGDREETECYSFYMAAILVWGIKAENFSEKTVYRL